MTSEKFVYWVSGIYLAIIAGFVAWSLLVPLFAEPAPATVAEKAPAALTDS